ncbi:MAG: hypothetical protein AABZ60_21985, partial [Planctomycetota bacterium]
LSMDILISPLPPMPGKECVLEEYLWERLKVLFSMEEFFTLVALKFMQLEERRSKNLDSNKICLPMKEFRSSVLILVPF